MGDRYYDVYVFNWGNSLRHVKTALMLNREYKKPKMIKEEDGTTTLRYILGNTEDHTSASFLFDAGGLVGAVYEKRYPDDDGFARFDLYLEQRKILTQRYGRAVLSQQDPKARTARTVWDLERLRIEYTLADDESGEGVSEIHYISKVSPVRKDRKADESHA